MKGEFYIYASIHTKNKRIDGDEIEEIIDELIEILRKRELNYFASKQIIGFVSCELDERCFIKTENE